MRALLKSVGLLLALTVIGTLGLRIIEQAPWLDCLFMAVISVTTIEDFLEVTDQTGIDLELADLQLHEQSRYVGKRPSQTDLHEKGVMILGVRRADGQRLIPPPGDTELRVGDCLFILGSTAAVNDMINAADV